MKPKRDPKPKRETKQFSQILSKISLWFIGYEPSLTSNLPIENSQSDTMFRAVLGEHP